MKKKQTIPRDEGFWSFYSPVIEGTRPATYFSQGVSALTQFFILYGLLYVNVLPISEGWAHFIALWGGLSGAVLIEVVQRHVWPVLIRIILYGRLRGLELVMFIPMVVVALVFTLSGGYLSFYGGIDAVKAYTPDVGQVDVSVQVDSQRNDLASLSAERVLRRGQLDGVYDDLVSSTLSKWKSRIAVMRGKERENAALVEAGHAWAAGHVVKWRGKVIAAEADRDFEKSELEGKRAAALSSLEEEYRVRREGIMKHYGGLITGIMADHGKKKGNREAYKSKWGYGLAWFTVGCLIFLICAFVIDEAYKKGSGIVDKREHGGEEQGIFREFYEIVRDRILGWLRKKIRGLRPSSSGDLSSGMRGVFGGTPAIGFHRRVEDDEGGNSVITRAEPNEGIDSKLLREVIQGAIKSIRVKEDAYLGKQRNGIGRAITNKAGLEAARKKIDKYRSLLDRV